MILQGYYQWGGQKLIVEFVGYQRSDPRFCRIYFPSIGERFCIEVDVFERLISKSKLSPLEQLALCAEEATADRLDPVQRDN